MLMLVQASMEILKRFHLPRGGSTHSLGEILQRFPLPRAPQRAPAPGVPKGHSVAWYNRHLQSKGRYPVEFVFFPPRGVRQIPAPFFRPWTGFVPRPNKLILAPILFYSLPFPIFDRVLAYAQ